LLNRQSKKGVGLDYLKWSKNTFPELSEMTIEAINAYIDEEKLSSKLLREFVKVLGFLLFTFPFNLYLLVSGNKSFDSPLYWVLVLFSILIGGFVSLFCEQKLIKGRIRKIVRKNPTNTKEI